MDKIEVFQVLGIESTKDEKALKKAYHEKLAVTNPEDDPEGFKHLRTAYEEALRLAREPEEDEKPERDETPSGLWVERASEIYSNIRSRQDVGLWKKLFREECFLALDEEENCRMKFFVFLMTHFKLPTAVWKLLDAELGIASGAKKLREHFPPDFIRYIVNKCERGEDVDFTQFEGEEDAPYDLFLQYYDRCWQALQEKNVDLAAQCIESADALHIYHPVMEICRAELYVRRGKAEEAVSLMESLREKYPDDTMIAYNTAEMMWKNSAQHPDYRRRSAEIFLKLKAVNDSHYMANMRLTEWYYEQGEYKTAKKCAEKVLASGSDEDFIRLLNKVNVEIEKDLERDYRENGGWEAALDLCWCYLQDGRTSKGIMMAAALENKLPPHKETEWKGLMAKLYVEESDYEDSIRMAKMWEEDLLEKLPEEEGEEKERDLDRVRQARMIRMQCYHNLGFREESNWPKAIEEGKSVLDDTAKDIGVLLEMAQIYTEMKEYEKSLEIVNNLVSEYQIYAACATSLEVYRRQLDAGGVVSAATQCIQHFPGFAKAYEYVAKVYLDLQRTDDLKRVLDDAETNGVKSVILDAYRYQITNKPMEVSVLNEKLKDFRENFRRPLEHGNTVFYEQGLPILLKYVYNYPDSYMMVELAIFHRAGHQYERARECFEKALALNPANPYAFNGLSFTYRYMNDFENALICMKKAMLYMNEDMSPAIYTDLADLYLLLGDYERALEALKQYEVKLNARPGLCHREKLANCYMRMGRLKEAEKIYIEIYRRDKRRAYTNFVSLYLRFGEREKAESLLCDWEREVRESDQSDAAKYRCGRGWLELLLGSPDAALKEFHRAVKKATADNMEEVLQEALFACIVCGDDNKGAKYSARLSDFLKNCRYYGRNIYFNKEKTLMWIEILAAWYPVERDAAGTEEMLEKLFEREKQCGICHCCSTGVCRKTESLRILFLVRQGKRQEARELLRHDLELLPLDGYLLAIRRNVPGMGQPGGKDPI